MSRFRDPSSRRQRRSSNPLKWKGLCLASGLCLVVGVAGVEALFQEESKPDFLFDAADPDGRPLWVSTRGATHAEGSILWSYTNTSERRSDDIDEAMRRRNLDPPQRDGGSSDPAVYLSDDECTHSTLTFACAFPTEEPAQWFSSRELLARGRVVTIDQGFAPFPASLLELDGSISTRGEPAIRGKFWLLYPFSSFRLDGHSFCGRVNGFEHPPGIGDDFLVLSDRPFIKTLAGRAFLRLSSLETFIASSSGETALRPRWLVENDWPLVDASLNTLERRVVESWSRLGDRTPLID